MASFIFSKLRGGVEGISGGGREVVEGLKGIPALKRTVRLVHFFLIAMM